MRNKFTSKEIEVLKLLTEGKNSNEIAEEMGNSKRTIDGVRVSLLVKSNCKNVAQLCYFAGCNNIIKNNNL